MSKEELQFNHLYKITRYINKVFLNDAAKYRLNKHAI